MFYLIKIMTNRWLGRQGACRPTAFPYEWEKIDLDRQLLKIKDGIFILKQAVAESGRRAFQEMG